MFHKQCDSKFSSLCVLHHNFSVYLLNAAPALPETVSLTMGSTDLRLKVDVPPEYRADALPQPCCSPKYDCTTLPVCFPGLIGLSCPGIDNKHPSWSSALCRIAKKTLTISKATAVPIHKQRENFGISILPFNLVSGASVTNQSFRYFTERTCRELANQHCLIPIIVYFHLINPFLMLLVACAGSSMVYLIEMCEENQRPT